MIRFAHKKQLRIWKGDQDSLQESGIERRVFKAPALRFAENDGWAINRTHF
jgi:hypothetical protein